jgi:hypothetical protein
MPRTPPGPGTTVSFPCYHCTPLLPLHSPAATACPGRLTTGLCMRARPSARVLMACCWMCREQAQRQNIQKNAGNATGIDLLGYVEFQRSIRCASCSG